MGKQWKVFLNEGPFSRKYLQERLHVLAVVEANIVGSDAVHCGEGFSALQGRLHCTVSWTDLSIPKCITRYWGDVSQWSENLNVMYRLTDYME